MYGNATIFLFLKGDIIKNTFWCASFIAGDADLLVSIADLDSNNSLLSFLRFSRLCLFQ